MINLNWKKIDTNETSMNWSNCQECCSSWRTSSQGTCQSSLSVKAQEEPHPKGPISLPQVSQLTKNLVPRNQSVCPKCPAHKESHPKGPISPTPSVKAHKEPCPMGPVSLPWVPMFNVEEPHPKGPVYKSAFSVDAHKKPCPLGPVCLSQRDMCDSSQSRFFCQELLSIEHDNATCYL